MPETRPQSAQLVRADGTSVPIRFVVTPTAHAFLAAHRDTGKPVTLEPGDALHIDELGPYVDLIVRGANTWSRS